MAGMMLHPDEDFMALNLRDIIVNLSVIVDEVALEFASFDSPLSLLLPYETHRVAAEALTASLRLRNQLKYFNAGFPRSSSIHRSSSRPPSRTRSARGVILQSENLASYNGRAITAAQTAEDFIPPNNEFRLPSQEEESNFNRFSSFLSNVDKQADASASTASLPDKFGASQHKPQHYYHFDETYDDMPVDASTDDSHAPLQSPMRPPDCVSSNTLSTFYRTLLEREERECRARTASIIQRERRILCISLTMPFLTLSERFCLIANLSTGCHRLAMTETPVTEADFCDPETEGLMLLRAFPRISTQLPRTLRFLRANCVEHAALSSCVGDPLEQLCLINVPTPGGSSLLPSRLPAVREVAQRQVAAFLSPLSPLSSWLYVAGKRCKKLRFLSLSFYPSLPFSVSNGMGHLQPPTPFMMSSVSSPQAYHHRHLSSVLSNYGFYSESDSLASARISPVSSFFFNRLISHSASPLVFQSLQVLQFVSAASVMPLSLLLCASFPRLETLMISTTSALFTGNLAEFLSLFATRCLRLPDGSGKSTSFTSLMIDHASNIANVSLLESIKFFTSLQSLRLTSPNSFGSNVHLSHPNLRTLELSFHQGLAWHLDTPNLRRLVFILPDIDSLVVNSIRQTLAEQLDRSAHLSQFVVECFSTERPLLELLDRQAIRRYCFL